MLKYYLWDINIFSLLSLSSILMGIRSAARLVLDVGREVAAEAVRRHAPDELSELRMEGRSAPDVLLELANCLRHDH